MESIERRLTRIEARLRDIESRLPPMPWALNAGPDLLVNRSTLERSISVIDKRLNHIEHPIREYPDSYWEIGKKKS